MHCLAFPMQLSDSSDNELPQGYNLEKWFAFSVVDFTDGGIFCSVPCYYTKTCLAGFWEISLL